MNDKILIVTGGTGGHVIPAGNFGNYLLKNNLDCNLIIDDRGKKYLKNYNGNIKIINSSSITGNIIKKIIAIIKIIFAFIKSIYLILILKPKIIISFGSYASFSPMLASVLFKRIFKIKLYIHEQNSVIGRTNKLFMRFSNKIFLNFNIKSKIQSKYLIKSFVVGTPNKIEHLYPNKNNLLKKNKFTIFIYGGSQGSEKLIIFIINFLNTVSKEEIKNFKFIVQCPDKLINKLSNKFKEIDCEFIIKNYFYNIINILRESSLVISRAGAGTINDLIKYKLPSILLPLPNSKDNHQYENALILSKINAAIIINQFENDFKTVKQYIYEIYKDKNKIESVINNLKKIEIMNSNEIMYKLINNEK